MMHVLSLNSLIFIAVLIIFGVIPLIYYWYKNGRDYWFRDNLFGTKDETGSVKPILSNKAIVVEYMPPDNLRPAEIGVVENERVSVNDITATIIYLAMHGYLLMFEIPGKGILGKKDYQLQQTNKKTDGLLSYEKILLDKLFSNKNVITVSELTSFFLEMKEIKEDIYKDVVDKKLFPSNPEWIRTKFALIGYVIFMILWGFLLIFSQLYRGRLIEFIAGNIFIVDILISFSVVGIFYIVFSKFMPRRTAYGYEIYRKIKGYRLYITTVEKYKQRFVEKNNIADAILPYAIVFGLTGKFANAMHNIGTEPHNKEWYKSNNVSSESDLINNISDFSGSINGVMNAVPKK